MATRIIKECVVGCKALNGGFLVAKNRDRTYGASVAIIHHVDADKEFIIMYDKDTNYMEGLNVKTGVGILNVAVENSLDHGKNPSSEGKRIFSALLRCKTPEQAVKMLASKGNEVYGNTLVFDNNKAFMLEFTKDAKPKVLNYKDKTHPIVRTNHTELIKDGGYTPDIGVDYISSKTRQATSEVIFSYLDSAEEILDALNYKLFGSHSTYDTNRDTSAYGTCSQIAIDTNKNEVYFRSIPGRGKFIGVVKSGNGKKPQGKVKVLEYNEAVEIPFVSWSASTRDKAELSEKLELVRLLDPGDKYSDTDGLTDIEKASLKEKDLQTNLDYFIDRENEIIKKLVSVEDLYRHEDSALKHLLGDRDFEEEHQNISKLLYDFENSTMDLYRLQSKLKSQNKLEEKIDLSLWRKVAGIKNIVKF